MKSEIYELLGTILLLIILAAIVMVSVTLISKGFGGPERRCVDGKIQIKENNYWVIDQIKTCVEK